MCICETPYKTTVRLLLWLSLSKWIIRKHLHFVAYSTIKKTKPRNNPLRQEDMKWETSRQDAPETLTQRWVWLSLWWLLLIQGVMTASGRENNGRKIIWIFRNVDWRRKKSEKLADSISSLRKSPLSRLMKSLCLFIHVSLCACLFNFLTPCHWLHVEWKTKEMLIWDVSIRSHTWLHVV